MLELEIDGTNYRVTKMSVLDQNRLARKLSPLLPKLVPLFSKLSGEDWTKDLDGLAEAASPLLEAYANMSDADADYITGVCMNVVLRDQGGRFFPAWSKTGNVPMFEIDLAALNKLIFSAIRENLGPFIQGFLAKAPASNPQVQ